MPPVRVALEIGSKRTFASALDWPGWCRSAKGQAEAIQALIDYAPRYAEVASKAGVPFPARPRNFEGAEHLDGDATTDYGAPGAVAQAERDPLGKAEMDRMCALVAACWSVFDEVMKSAPAELRKGPRGGGRDRDEIVAHVFEAEAGYAPKLALKLQPPRPSDRSAVAAHRQALLAAFRSGASGVPLRERGWPVRYAARRIAWHSLDHAWEIEDRSKL